MRRRLENCKEVPKSAQWVMRSALSDGSPMRDMPRESELKWIFESRELSMEPKCKYEGVRLYGQPLQFDHYCRMSARTSSLGLRPPNPRVVYVFAFSMMKAPNGTDHRAEQEFGVLNRTVDHGLRSIQYCNTI